MSAEDRCRELIKKRASIKAKLTQFMAYFNTAKTCEQLSDSQLVELDMRIKKLDDSYDSFDSYQSELEMLAEDPTEQYTARELFERSYYKEIAAARELVDRHRSQRAKEVQSEVPAHRVSETALLEQVLQRVRYWPATENQMAELKGLPRRRNHGGNQGQELTAAYVAPRPHRSSAAWQRWRRKSSRHKDEKGSHSSGLQYNLSSTHTRS
ncbi:uncharacterized protein LOC133531064 isoform X3 [Cydia pomonella]|uniref:uncharacterized protein LOC133531064 isoform X3 n=2 Tax=Cydia pomonella TaxID=82600 RepID=UPI002ADE72B4|nr:uncharacterized protein LOC133531064 isoform X3 [Cydia pomonella]